MVFQYHLSNGPPCPVSAHQKTSLDFSKKGFTIYRCRGCGFQFVYPPPGNLAAIYSGEYFCGAVQGFGYVNYEEDKVVMQPFFEAVLDAIEQYMPSPGRLLDVGAATGFFIKLAGERGWQATGIEISPYAVEVAAKNGVSVIHGTLETVVFEPSSFDVITLLDVIEHVSDPVMMIEKCARLLRAGGLLAINTPDTSSLWARIFGPRWHSFCPPEHLSYFNPVNLSGLLRDHCYTVERVSTLGKRFTPSYVFSMLFRWQGLGFWKWLGQRIENTLFNRIPLPINIRDNFFLIARK